MKANNRKWWYFSHKKQKTVSRKVPTKEEFERAKAEKLALAKKQLHDFLDIDRALHGIHVEDPDYVRSIDTPSGSAAGGGWRMGNPAKTTKR